MYKDIEPVRLYYYALSETDNASACLYYYRILEFYSFLMKYEELEKRRRDYTLSPKDFLFEVSKVLTQNEKQDICSFVSRLITTPIMDLAITNNLVKAPDNGSLCNALYEFRNSIVHAKYEHRMTMTVESILNPSAEIIGWKRILRELALEVLNRYGR